MEISADKGTPEDIQTACLEFDPENPRFPNEIASGGDDLILQKMIKSERLAELMQSIGVQNFFSGEPLLVTAEGAPPGKYYVVEGNRRLAALKLLNKGLKLAKYPAALERIIDEAQYRPVEVPCLIFKERKSVLRYLGFRHITGIKSWGPLAKARYLQQLQEQFYEKKAEDEQHRMLAKEIGSRSDYVGQMLSGLAVYDFAKEKDFFNLPGVNADTIEFTLLTTALSYSNIVSHLGLKSRTSSDLKNLNSDHVKEIFSWIYAPDQSGNTVVADSRKLKDLAAVIADEDSLAHLRKTRDLNTSYMMSEGPKVALYKLIDEAHKKLRAAYDTIPNIPQSHLDQTHVEKSNSAFDMAKFVRNMIRERLDDE